MRPTGFRSTFETPLVFCQRIPVDGLGDVIGVGADAFCDRFVGVPFAVSEFLDDLLSDRRPAIGDKLCFLAHQRDDGLEPRPLVAAIRVSPRPIGAEFAFGQVFWREFSIYARGRILQKSQESPENNPP